MANAIAKLLSADDNAHTAVSLANLHLVDQISLNWSLITARFEGDKHTSGRGGFRFPITSQEPSMG